MSERTSYANGVPSWVDLATPDVTVSVAFYGGLLGWDYAAAPGDPAQTGGYGLFSLRDKVVAGVGPLQNATQPAVWNTYIAVDDADATVTTATAAGGRVMMPAMDVMDAGRLAYLLDPEGASFGIWQAGRRTGAELVNEPGAFGWSELLARDTASAATFYGAVFGWDPEVQQMEGIGEYTILNLDGAAIGGIMAMGGRFPPEIPSHWVTYFVVADADASVATAQELGGAVVQPATDAPGVGRVAALDDPHGTRFAIIALANPGA